MISQQVHADDLKTQSNVNTKEIDSPTTIALNDQWLNSGFPLSLNKEEIEQKLSSVLGAYPALWAN